MNYQHQKIEDILNTCTPAQKIIWNWFFLTFGENISVRQIVFQGSPIGELSNYSNRKMYFFYEFSISPGAGGQATANVFDYSNVLTDVITSGMPYWNATAAAVNYSQNRYEQKNIICSRMGFINAPLVNCIGYRIGV